MDRRLPLQLRDLLVIQKNIENEVRRLHPSQISHQHLIYVCLHFLHILDLRCPRFPPLVNNGSKDRRPVHGLSGHDPREVLETVIITSDGDFYKPVANALRHWELGGHPKRSVALVMFEARL